MHKLTFMPQGVDIFLPDKAPLTQVEYAYNGKNIIPFGCRVGACGACVIHVTQGGENLGIKKDGERIFLEKLGYAGETFRLACQCQITGSVTLQENISIIKHK